MEQQQQTSAQSSQIERGDTLLKQGAVREAAEVFAGVVRAEPNNPAGHLGLAEASLALGDFANADLRASSAARTAQARFNDALKSRAGAGANLADKEKTLCDRRKSAIDAWLKLNVKG